jgi:hypothetical protein
LPCFALFLSYIALFLMLTVGHCLPFCIHTLCFSFSSYYFFLYYCLTFSSFSRFFYFIFSFLFYSITFFITILCFILYVLYSILFYSILFYSIFFYFSYFLYHSNLIFYITRAVLLHTTTYIHACIDRLKCTCV